MAQSTEVETFKMWKAMLLNDLRTLKQLEGLDGVRHAFKEQEIGQHCCQAGESLTDAELALLKKKVHLTEQQWRAFKSKLLLVPE